ncbi:MAG: O-antigen ligase family protein, partial [Planctomycetes bacterium]|nr:O-antigen ligase family protein [Planctomycetota bacterium]
MSRTTDSLSRSLRDRRKNSAQEPERGASRHLRILTDAGLASVIFVAPLFMGGRYDVGRLAYVACVSVAAIGCVGRLCLVKGARWRLTGGEPLLLAGLILLFVQLMPMPTTVLDGLSSEYARLLPLWRPGGLEAASLGTWNQLSLAPQATRAGMVTFLAHCLLFLVVVQRIRDRRDVERLLRWLAVAAVGMAGLGLAQLLAGNGKFLWIYEHPSRDTYGVVKGTFQNQNHFAHFLILGLGPLFWWIQRLWSTSPRPVSFADRRREWQQLARPALIIGTGIVLTAILMTFSRGGVVTAFVACAVSLGLMGRRGLLGTKALLSFAGMTVVMVAALAIHGYEPLARRLSTLRDSESLEELSRGRKELWEAHLTAIPRFPW